MRSSENPTNQIKPSVLCEFVGFYLILFDFLDFRPASWPASQLVGWLAGWLAGQLAGLKSKKSNKINGFIGFVGFWDDFKIN